MLVDGCNLKGLCCNFLPGENLLLVTGYIVKEWEKLQKETKTEVAS